MWDVPPLAEQLRKAEEANKHKTPLSKHELEEYLANAPEWYKVIMKRRQAEERISDDE